MPDGGRCVGAGAAAGRRQSPSRPPELPATGAGRLARRKLGQPSVLRDAAGAVHRAPRPVQPAVDSINVQAGLVVRSRSQPADLHRRTRPEIPDRDRRRPRLVVTRRSGPTRGVLGLVERSRWPRPNRPEERTTARWRGRPRLGVAVRVLANHDPRTDRGSGSLISTVDRGTVPNHGVVARPPTNSRGRTRRRRVRGSS